MRYVLLFFLSLFWFINRMKSKRDSFMFHDQLFFELVEDVLLAIEMICYEVQLTSLEIMISYTTYFIEMRLQK
ncbi:hypothetical protein F4820DRAFT_430012 [Hypoxylon rubiginosum]|uniref:Uncharacterized protein n=1 Tax=Hypoxylon rubiginosum TaxID=110542 RepID=A0ACB9YTE6_9PEZI|nr:hypothetical protein F4820DRAFT_430012 [Hypoxylon rubiginosum]